MDDAAEVVAQIGMAATGTEFVKPLHSKIPPSLQPEAQPLPAPFVAVITGASRGIGRASAELFARAGATGLILTSRTLSSLAETKRLCESASPAPSKLKISLVQFEAGSEADTQKLGEAVRAEHGRLDLLLNNAGLVSTNDSAFGSLFDVTHDQFMDVTMKCNYYGRFLTMREFLPLLLESEGGVKMVINITSICSHFVGFGPKAFNISELASNRLTEIAAANYADKGLLAYSVHPGFVLTTPPPGMSLDTSSHAFDEAGLCGSFCLWLVRNSPQWLSGRYLSSAWDVDELVKKRDEIVMGDKLKARMIV